MDTCQLHHRLVVLYGHYESCSSWALLTHAVAVALLVWLSKISSFTFCIHFTSLLGEWGGGILIAFM